MSQQIVVCSMHSEIHAILALAYSESIEKAAATVSHRAVIKALNISLSEIADNRRLYIAAHTVDGEDPRAVSDRATEEYPSLEIENAIRAENIRFKGQCAIYDAHIERAWRLIPDGTYDAYRLYLNGDIVPFAEKCGEFAESIGCKNTHSKAARKRFAATMCRFIGAKKSSASRVIKTGYLTDAMGRKQFNGMFISAFCDAYAMTSHKLVSGDKIDADNAYAKTK